MRNTICKTDHFVHLVVPRLSVNSESSSSPTSQPQESLRTEADQASGNRAASSSAAGSVFDRGMLFALCEKSKTSLQTGNYRTVPMIPFAAMVEYHPTPPKDQARIHQFGIFLGCELIVVRIWRGEILIADLADLEKLDPSDISHRRIKAKEVLTSQKMMNSFSR